MSRDNFTGDDYKVYSTNMRIDHENKKMVKCW